MLYTNFNWNLIEDFIISIAALLIPCCPVFLGILSNYSIITIGFLKVGLFICFIVYIVFPVVYKYSYSLQRATVFLNYFHVPHDADYDNPEKYGIKNVRNFYIKTKDGDRIGTWHILPSNITIEQNNTLDDDFSQNILNNGQKILIYCHGNGGTRLSSHRIETYEVLRQFFHVIAFDYRSYGDSSKVELNEMAVVHDVINVFQWIRNLSNGDIYIWGHSLGTSIASHAILKLQNTALTVPVGLVLEAPFNNLREEISEFPLARLFKYLPWFHSTVVVPVSEHFHFESDEYVCGINFPIMMLHAEDDNVVPYKLGHKLYESAKDCRKTSQGGIFFHSYNAKYKLGHKYICRAPNLPHQIRDFILYTSKFKIDGK